MEAQFQPAARPGYATDAFAEGQSLMQRATAAKQQEQLNAQRIEENRIMLPVKVAAAHADIVSAGSSITAATRQQIARAQAASISPALQNEFLDALNLADWDAQSAALSRVQAKAAPLGQFEEYKGFTDAVDKARANAVSRALTDQKLEEAQAVAQMAIQGRMATSENSLEGRKYAADRGVESRQIGADATIESAKTGAAARKDVAAGNREASMKRTEYRGFISQAIESDRLAAKAATAKEPENAAMYAKHAKEFRRMAEEVNAEVPGPMFNVPGLSGNAAEAPASKAEEPKLYVPPEREGEFPSFAPSVKTNEDILKAVQQMVDDYSLSGGQEGISPDQARETLTKLGFKRKGG